MTAIMRIQMTRFREKSDDDKRALDKTFTRPGVNAIHPVALIDGKTRCFL